MPVHVRAWSDRHRNHFYFPKELLFPKPCLFLSVAGLLFCSRRALSRMYAGQLLELDAVRFAALEKTRHSLNFELPQAQGASNATPQKVSVHRKIAVLRPLGRLTPFRRAADRSEAHHL